MSQLDALAFEMPRRPVRFFSETILPNGEPMNYFKNPNDAVLGESAGDDLIYNSPIGTLFQMDDGTYYYKKAEPNDWYVLGAADGAEIDWTVDQGGAEYIHYNNINKIDGGNF